MNAALAIAGRELASYFRRLSGWALLALFLLLTGVFFAVGTIQPGEPASMRAFFTVADRLAVVIAPAISMRLIAEELRTGTIETLMTAPVSDWEVVFGKFLGGLGFFLALLAPTLVYAIALEALAEPDWGAIAAGYIGLLLVGSLYVAIGLAFSAATSNQLVALLGTLFFLVLARIGPVLAAAQLGPPLDEWLYGLSIDVRVADFAKGVLDTGHVIFFLGLSAWFVVVAVIIVESRRWR